VYHTSQLQHWAAGLVRLVSTVQELLVELQPHWMAWMAAVVECLEQVLQEQRQD
jgi:hypothetical protein